MVKDRLSATASRPRKGLARVIGWFVRAIALTGLITITLLLVWAFESRKMPPLYIWHTTPLTSEFTAQDAGPHSTLKDYLEQEERLFRELQVKIYDKVSPTAEMATSRYRTGGLQDPAQLPRNWNRTFELVPESIQGGALLLHGLTDSPYSLRRIGEILHDKGFLRSWSAPAWSWNDTGRPDGGELGRLGGGQPHCCKACPRTDRSGQALCDGRILQRRGSNSQI